MIKFSLTGVPEHFNFPVIKAIEDLPELGITWEYSPGGTGEMLEKLSNKKVDAAIILTEGFVKAQSALERPPVFHSIYVESPLTWGIHTVGNSSYSDLPLQANFPTLISRVNSGSHLMFKLLKSQQNWKDQSTEYVEVGNLNGAINYAKKNQSDFIFLWEKFTTKPYCEEGIFKRIGELPTPWPAFVLVIHPDSVGPDFLDAIDSLYGAARNNIKSHSFAKELSSFSGLPTESVYAWLKTTKWFSELPSEIVLDRTARVLKDIGVISRIPEISSV